MTAAVAVGYVGWLGWHWLPIGYTSRELAAAASRVWDIRRELLEHGRLPWWTPSYLSGYGYALQYAQGLPLVPWVVLSAIVPIATAGKLVALGALGAGAVAMYFCARAVLGDDRAATLSALAFLLHPQQLVRAGAAEHIGVVVALALIPLAWLCSSRALSRGDPHDAVAAALSLVALFWTSSKEVVVLLPFLLAGSAVTAWQARRRRPLVAVVRTGAAVAVLSLGLGAFCLVPTFLESQHVKLLAGDPVETTQRFYAFKSLLALVDRGAVVTGAAVDGVTRDLERRGGAVAPHEGERVTRVLALRGEAPGKYTGIVLLALVGVTMLFNSRRANRTAFWSFVVMLLVSVACASGVDGVWEANRRTLDALFALPGVPAWCRFAVLGAIAALIGFVALFAVRKLSTPRRWLAAAAVVPLVLFFAPFRIFAALPVFREVRAPFVFYDLPEVFFVAMLAGFFVTDVLPGTRWRRHGSQVVAVVALLMLVDHWTDQQPMKTTDVPARTLANLESVYRSLRDDERWVKVYDLPTRYLHLLGPMYGGKPVVYEAWTNWMSPLGTALLNQAAYTSVEAHRAFLDLIGAGYVVFDKSSPGDVSPVDRQLFTVYRQGFGVAHEDEDFVLFRNPGARPYVAGYGRADLYVGDVRDSAQLALALSERAIPLVQAPAARLVDVPIDRLREFDVIYVEGETDLRALPADVSAKVIAVRRDREVPLTRTPDVPVSLEAVQLTREHAGLVRIGLDAPRRCLAVVAESYYPYWRAEIDGRAAEVLRVSTGLMGVWLGEGRHEVVLRFVPPRVYAVAAATSVVTFLGCVALAWSGRRR